MFRFEQQFVYFEWDDVLKDKECFVADDVEELKILFYDGRRHMVSKGYKARPFAAPDGLYYRFVYYDPNYDLKKAYEEGKQVQFFSPQEQRWIDDAAPSWDNPLFEYRIKPEEPETRHMTYRELAEWLAKGNGQYKFCDCAVPMHSYVFTYDADKDSTIAPEYYKIRRWGSDEWIEPTADVYEADCKKDGENEAEGM